MDDQTAAWLAEANLTVADHEYHQLRAAVFAHQTGDGFVTELTAASQHDMRAFVRAGNDPQVRARAAELGVDVPTYVTLPIPEAGR
jgi:hypothetical protein